MKFQKSTIKALLLAAALTMGCVPTVMAADYEGHLDTVSDAVISGWAKNPSSPDSPVKVSITVTPEGSTEPVREAAMFANEYRDDAEYAYHSAGYCGFSWDIDWSELDNGVYQISLRTGTGRAGKTLTYTNTAGKEIVADVEEQSLSAAAGYQSLGVFKTTAYCPCNSCSEGWGRSTSTGAMATARHTIAVDPRVIPYGSKVMIDGIVYTAEDRGGGVRGNHIDVFYDTHGETRQHGVRYSEVFLIP